MRFGDFTLCSRLKILWSLGQVWASETFQSLPAQASLSLNQGNLGQPEVLFRSHTTQMLPCTPHALLWRHVLSLASVNQPAVKDLILEQDHRLCGTQSISQRPALPLHFIDEEMGKHLGQGHLKRC